MTIRRIAAVLIVVLLTACGGGGGGGSSVPAVSNAPVASTSKTQAVQLSVHIPGATTSSSTRRAQYVASTTAGVLVQVYANSDTGHTTVLGVTATNVSPGSSACGGATGARTCAVAISAPAGADDFVFTTYDQVPNSPTTFAGNANVLAKGTVFDQTIVAAAANVVNVTLSGTINHLMSYPSQNTWVGNWGSRTYTLQIAAYDADNNVLIGAYDVPITLALTEHGGSGLTHLSLGGSSGTPSSSVTLAQSSDVATVQYAGGGTSGYSTSFSATTSTGISATATFDPLYVSSSSGAFTPATLTAQGTLNLTTPGQAATITFSEQDYTGPLYLGLGNCNGVVSVTSPSAGTNESSTITASGSGGTCTVYYQQGGIYYYVNITAPANTTASVVVPGATLGYVALGTGGVNIYTATGLQVGNIATSSSADVIGLDDSANLWVVTGPTNNNTTAGTITKYTAGGSTYPASYSLSSATYTPSDALHLAWGATSGAGELATVSFNSATNNAVVDVWDAGHTGAPSRSFAYPAVNGHQLAFLYVAHDGTLYVAVNYACGSNTCIEYTVTPAGASAPSRTILETHIADAQQVLFGITSLTVGPDGTMYVTEDSYTPSDTLGGVYVFPPTGTEHYVPGSFGPANPQAVDTDAAGNVYVLSNNGMYNTGVETGSTVGYVTVLSTDGNTVLRGFGYGSLDNPYVLTVAQDGTSFIATAYDPTNGVNGGVFLVPPSGYPITQISTVTTSSMITYNGLSEATSVARKAQSASQGTAHGSGSFSRLIHRK